MAEINPAAWFQNRSDHSASQLRLAIGGLLSHANESGSPPSLRPAGGVHPTSTMDVIQSSPTAMSVRVDKGIAVVTGTENALQGSYICINDALKTLTIAASDPSLTRIDLVIARVRDAQYSGVTNAWALEVVTGTPGAGAPALPASSLELARVTVGAGVVVITTANISYANRRYFSAAGGWEPWATIAAFDAFPWNNSPLWVYDIATRVHWHAGPAGDYDEFFTSRNANRGYFQGKYYTGGASLYGPATAEATVTNLDTGTITFPATGTAVGGEVHCFVSSTAANDRVTFRVRETNVAGAVRAEMSNILIPAASVAILVDFTWLMPVVSGSANMVLTCQRVSGTGNISVIGQGSTNPSWHIAKHYNTTGITVI